MHQETWTPLMEPALGSGEQLSFTTAGETSNSFVAWYATRLQETLARQGHVRRSNSGAFEPEAAADKAPVEAQSPVRLVLNLCDIDRPRPIHRRGQGTFVATAALHARARKAAASPNTICFTIQPSVVASADAPIVDRLAANLAVDPGRVLVVDPSLSIDPNLTLDKGGKKGPGTGPILFKCDSEAEGGPTCSCTGSNDCLKMGASGSCTNDSIQCDNANQTCTCRWDI